MISVTIDAILFYALLKMVSKVVDEVTVRFCDDGMRIRQLDMGEVSMVDAFIPRYWFQEYEVVTRTDDKGNTVGNAITFRISDIKFKKPKKDTVLSLEQGLTSGEGRVKLDLSGLTVTIPNFEGDAKELPLPKVNLKQKALTKPRLLLEFAKEAIHVNDSVRFVAKGSELELISKGEVSEMSKALRYEDSDISDFSLTEGVDAAYDANRFLKFVEASAGFDSVLVEFDYELPLRLTYTFMGVADITSWDQKAQVVFYLAPKVERDYTPQTQQAMNTCGRCGNKVMVVNVVEVDGKTMELCDSCFEQAKHEALKQAEEAVQATPEPVVEPQPVPMVSEVDQAKEIVKEMFGPVGAQILEDAAKKEQEQPKVEAYVCENCGRDIEEGKGKRLEDGDTWLCDACSICENCEKKPEPVVVDPLAAFRNRWSKK